MGGHCPIVWGVELSNKKETNIKYTAALNGHRSMILNATTNQKQAAVDGEEYGGGGGDEREVRGKCNSPLFWGRWILKKR